MAVLLIANIIWSSHCYCSDWLKGKLQRRAVVYATLWSLFVCVKCCVVLLFIECPCLLLYVELYLSYFY